MIRVIIYDNLFEKYYFTKWCDSEEEAQQRCNSFITKLCKISKCSVFDNRFCFEAFELS